MELKKKYKLRCFSCGNLFKSKRDVFRANGLPYCSDCMADQGSYDPNDYCPNEIDDERMRDEAYMRMYGEY